MPTFHSSSSADPILSTSFACHFVDFYPIAFWQLRLNLPRPPAYRMWSEYPHDVDTFKLLSLNRKDSDLPFSGTLLCATHAYCPKSRWGARNNNCLSGVMNPEIFTRAIARYFTNSLIFHKGFQQSLYSTTFEFSMAPLHSIPITNNAFSISFVTLACRDHISKACTCPIDTLIYDRAPN